MIDGAVFGREYNTRANYGAVMNYARVTPPAVKTNYVDIAGGNSSIDLTEAVGGVAYQDGQVEFKFTFPDRGGLQAMKDDLHGRRFDSIVLEREPEYYYQGRVEAVKEERRGSLWELTLAATVFPYKIEVQETEHNEEVAGKRQELLLINAVMPVMPRIAVEGNVYVKFGAYQCVLKNGEYEIPEITLHKGLNRLQVSGNGRLRFRYHKGKLI